MHFVTTQLKMALQQIFENVGAKISDVRAAVNRWAASIDVDVVRCRIPRPEFLKLSRVGIKKRSAISMNENDGVVEQRSASHHYANLPSLLSSCSTVAIAIAAMPSPRPIAPSRSFVVALMLIRNSVAPIACAIFFRIAGI